MAENQVVINTYKNSLPLVSALNQEMYGVIRWCTPSIHPRVPKVNGIYENDMSISYHSLGNPSLNTGVFKKAHGLAARAYGSDQTRFSVNGSSGSNFIVLRALSHQLRNVHMLAQRNIHKSISIAVEDYRINVKYLKPQYDESLQIFVPNTISEFEEELKAHPEINVVFVSNPTYEGLSLDLPKLVARIRRINPKVIIYVDEAWGSLFSFSSKMPVSAMEAGADICVQSTHKQGSGLQQTSMIHWKGKRIKHKHITDSYKSLITTSPSFHLLASLDGARYLMETQGKEIIDDLINTANFLRDKLGKIKGVSVVAPSEIVKKYPQVKTVDSTKVLVNISGTGIPGYSIAHELENKFKVVVEKYEADNILFITTLQNSEHEAEETAKRFKACLDNLSKKSQGTNKNSFPRFTVDIKQQLQPYIIREQKLVSVKLANSVGLTCAENVVPYPPGIPLIAKGEVIQKEHVDYLMALRKLKGAISVVMNDNSVKKIMVTKQKKTKLSDYVSPTILEAMEFDKTYFKIPTEECGEELVDLQKAVKEKGLTAVFNMTPTATGKERLFLVRKGLVEPISNAIGDLAKKGYFMRFEYVYRHLEDQRAAFERSVRTFKEKYPDLDKDTLLQIAGVFVAATPGTAAHVSGAAVDITLLDNKQKPLDMGVPYIHPGPESATYFSTISKAAKKNRKILCEVMEKNGFANYPYEYWHFSMGDKIAARVQGKKFAVYGPVLYNPENNSITVVDNPDRIFDVSHLFKIK